MIAAMRLSECHRPGGPPHLEVGNAMISCRDEPDLRLSVCHRLPHVQRTWGMVNITEVVRFHFVVPDTAT